MSKFFSDTFTDSNGTALLAHNPEIGGGWDYSNGNGGGMKILSNRLHYDVGGVGPGFVTVLARPSTPSGEYDIEATIYSNNLAAYTLVQILARYQDQSGTGSYIGVSIDAGSVSFAMRQHSGDTSLGFASITVNPLETHVFRYSVRDAAKIVYMDGVEVLRITDNTLTGAAGNKVGLLMYSPDNTIDGFDLDSLTMGPVYDIGATSASATSDTTATATSGAVSGDTGTWTAQYQRAPDVSNAPGTFADVGSAQAGLALGAAPASLNDTGRAPATKYWYRLKVTYALDSVVLYTNPVSATTSAAPTLTPGTTSIAASTPISVTVANTAASAGTAPYAYQFQRAPDVAGSPGSFANVGTARTGVSNGIAPTNLIDGSVAPSTKYWYRCSVTDSASGSGFTTPVTVTTGARSAATYYVSAAGNDLNDGLSSGTPWATLAPIAAIGLIPGDTLLLRGGDTFTGSVSITPAAQPTAATRITVKSYGSGRATISAPTTAGVAITDCGYVTVTHLTITGSGLVSTGTFPNRTVMCANANAGVSLVSSALNTYRTGIILDDLIVSGFKDGILGANTQNNPTAGFSDLRISRCIVHDCMSSGIVIYGNFPFTLQTWINRRVRIVDCQIYNIPGETASSGGSGFPCFLFHCQDSVIERCVAWNAGDAQSLSIGNGCVAFMFGHASNCVMRDCEGYGIFSPNGVDGNAFDFDAHCVNCVIEYCYGHDVDGACMLLWNDQGGSPSSSGSVVRYNVFVNGGRGNQSGIACGLAVTPFAGNDIRVHNNVFWQDDNGSTQTALLNCRSGSTTVLFNNIFSVQGGINFGTVYGTVCGNLYEVNAGSTFSLNISGSTYTSFAALRTGGQETLNGAPFGALGSAGFPNPGSTPVVMPLAPVSALVDYDLGSSSAARGIGVDPVAFVGLSPARDWHGNFALALADDTHSGFDAGAVRYGSTVPSGNSVAVRAMLFGSGIATAHATVTTTGGEGAIDVMYDAPIEVTVAV